MVSRKGSSFGNLRRATTKPPPPRVPLEVDVEVGPKSPRTASARNTTREGRVMVATFVDKGDHKRLRQIALDEDTDMQTLVRDALNLLLRDRNLPPLPQLPKVPRGPKPRV